MRYSQSIHAKQFAKAYLKEYGATLQFSDIENMKSVVAFLKMHHNFMSLVTLLVHTNDSDTDVLHELFDHFELPQTLHKLVSVLIHHKKLILFAQVLQDICCMYCITNNILEVTIYTATPLEQQQQEQFEKFFIKLSEKKIITTVVLDQSLIAGVRMQSDFFLWQYSIAARIATLRQNMLIEG